MAKVNYVQCAVCHKEYYLDRMLYEALVSGRKQKLKCPFCKKGFYLKIHKEQLPGTSSG
jgi:hypothetical protein